MALDDQLVQILALLSGQASQAEVIHDQKVRGEEVAERFLEGVVDACLGELLEQHVSAAEQHVEAGAYGGGAEALSQHGFADADRTDEENVFVLAQEVEAEQRLDLTPIELDRRTPIEAVKHHAIFEASLLEVAFERLVVTPLDLVGQEQRQERGVVELLGAGEYESLRQRRCQLAKL